MAASVLDFGLFANIIEIGNNKGIAMTTDGVGSKVLVAQRMGKYDTIGIDCIAMNVNDLLCVGATPLAMVDYIAVQTLDPGCLGELAKGLTEGALRAGISIPGGKSRKSRTSSRAKRARTAKGLIWPVRPSGSWIWTGSSWRTCSRGRRDHRH